MLYILQQMNVVNIVVVVSRWYGGVDLGPDRFKHISNQTKSIVQHYLKSQQSKFLIFI
jgi:putative IMPACT (imprinted ancient) family translation regulator